MTLREWALALARDGFYVFPIEPGVKSPPAFSGWQEAATRDESQIAQWWELNPDFNVGIYTGRFATSEALLVVDVDVKGEKNGHHSMLRLELEGRDLPETRSHATPTGGRHMFYRVRTPVRQGANVLGPGLDIRSKGGYVVGPGSVVAAGTYLVHTAVAIADAPQWLVDACGSPRTKDLGSRKSAVSIDPQTAAGRAIYYLTHDAPVAIEGEGGDDTTYRVGLALKDLGVPLGDAILLCQEYYNLRCSPPWEINDLETKLRNAYQYALEPIGSRSPEADFPPVESDHEDETLHPYHELNKEHSLVVAGGGVHVLWETVDQHSQPIVEHLDVGAFKLKFAPRKITIGKAEKAVTGEWLEWKGRRMYDGIIFHPGQEKEVVIGVNGSAKKYFNLWRGFSCTPADPGSTHRSLDLFLEHTRVNVCGNNDALYRWLLGYFAHLVQRPWEKPLVALVFRGGKGVGKNACIERVGKLLGRHFLVTANKRYLTGNFNSHLENCLLLALDEAFWSGDKQSEGIVKDLITGSEHLIEHKGKEPYKVANKTRVVILGNEDWLIPASHDERRFAVFDVGDGRKQDRAFFETMREGMEHGGYPVLLRYLLDYDCSGLDFNGAPATQGLADQKLHSLNPLFSWWHRSLDHGSLFGYEVEGWPQSVECDRFRMAFQRDAKDRSVKLWNHEDTRIGKMMRACLPSLVRKRVRYGERLPWVYELPPLEVCRKEWETFFQHPGQWEES
jgi:hypothetical protein